MKKEVINMDARVYLKNKKEHPPIITSLPDLSELGLGKSLWRCWVFDTLGILFRATPDKTPVIFYQTSRKYKGTLVDKIHYISMCAESFGFDMVWKKIILKQKPGSINLFRPTYSEMACFGRRVRPGKCSADVINKGKMIYPNAMDLNACQVAINFIKKDFNTILDPFCGMGSILAIANVFGLNAIGVDIDSNMCKIAKTLSV